MSTYIDPVTETWIEQLQARIEELEAENAIFRNADYDALQSGSRIAELEKSAIIWRKYPDEKPFNSEEYLVI